MSRPNTRNDPQAPLLTGDRPPADVEDEQLGNKKITIFNTTFSISRLIVVLVGAIALIAIGVSIAAIGNSSCLVMLFLTSHYSSIRRTSRELPY
jgi:hypothetical protein